MIEIIKEMRSINKDIPLLVHANAGLPIIENGKSVFPESPEEMSRQMIDLLDAGANIVGGCCGTTPAHIQVTRQPSPPFKADFPNESRNRSFAEFPAHKHNRDHD